MDLAPGTPIAGQRLDRVFIGSCTNSRIEDLRVAAGIIRGRHVAPHVQAMVVPGSGLVKRQAEDEGIADTLHAAGFDWREPRSEERRVGKEGVSTCRTTVASYQ